VGRRAAEKLLSLDKRPTALFVANNEMTAGALSARREQKIRIPDEISLVGFDDARWAQFSDPPLTIVAQPTSAMGKRSAELLLARSRKKKELQQKSFRQSLWSEVRPRHRGTRFRVSGFKFRVPRKTNESLGTRNRNPKPGT